MPAIRARRPARRWGAWARLCTLSAWRRRPTERWMGGTYLGLLRGAGLALAVLSTASIAAWAGNPIPATNPINGTLVVPTDGDTNNNTFNNAGELSINNGATFDNNG